MLPCHTLLSQTLYRVWKLINHSDICCLILQIPNTASATRIKYEYLNLATMIYCHVCGCVCVCGGGGKGTGGAVLCANRLQR